jgi:hypothetical protein
MLKETIMYTDDMNFHAFIEGGAYRRWHFLVVGITISSRKHFMGSKCTLHCNMGNIL